MPKESFTDDELDMLTDEERQGLLEDDGADEEGDDENGESSGEAGAAEDKAETGEKGDVDGKADAGVEDGAGQAEEPEKAAAKPAGESEAEDPGAAEEAGSDTNVEEPHSPLPKYDVPANADARLKEIEAELDALDGQVDDGEITMKEFRAKERALRSESADIREQMMRASISRDAEVQTWFKQTVPAFLAEHPEYEAGGILHDMLNTKVKALQAAAAEAGNSQTSPAILRQAHESVRAELAKVGLEKKSATTQDGAKKEKPKRELPPTLAHVPAADISDTDSEFAYLDRLSGDAYEDALAKLSDDQRDRYLAS